MCEPTTIALVATAAAGATSAYGQIQQGKVAAAVGRNNQMMAEYAAKDAERRGEEQATQIAQRARQVFGAQRASMAAKGLDLGEGTAAELQDQTDFFGQTDAVTARNNGRREAWTDRQQGAMARYQGDAARANANLGAFSTLLGTGGKVAGKWY